MAKKSFEETYRESVGKGKKYTPSEQIGDSGKSRAPASELEAGAPDIAKELESDTAAKHRERMSQQKPKMSDTDLTKKMQESIGRGKPKIVENFKSEIKSGSGAGRLGRAAGAAGVGLLAYDAAKNVVGDSGEKAYKEKVGELASSKQREKTKAAAREAKMEADTQDVKRPYMAPKTEKPVQRKRAESASYNPPPSYVRDQYPDRIKEADAEPVNESGHISYDAPDEAPYAKGGKIGRGMGAATRGGGCVMKRSSGGKVMSRGAAKRGFGKESR